MIVGIGSGTTVAEAIKMLGERAATGLRITSVATSRATAALLRRAAISLVDFSSKAIVDLAIDGVDEIDPDFRAVKGAGGAMLREKVVAAAARRMIVIADSSKQVDHLGTRPLPIEVLPFAAGFVASALGDLGCVPALRNIDRGTPYVTDQGNWIFDSEGGDLTDPAALAAAIAEIPGVLAHGMFLTEIDALYVASPDLAVICRERGTLLTSNTIPESSRP